VNLYRGHMRRLSGPGDVTPDGPQGHSPESRSGVLPPWGLHVARGFCRLKPLRSNRPQAPFEESRDSVASVTRFAA